MNTKNFFIAGITGGIVLSLLMVVSGFLVNLLIPTDLSQYGGMRSMNDPVMTLFYLYPFVIAFATAFLFDIVNGILEGTLVRKGLRFGGLLIAIMTIPSLYVMYTSMTWPMDFYISTAIWEIVSFPLVGILYARIWKT
ncbi:MAG TPA: hypothetical protein VHN82_00300 [Methanoregula sp.]|nr:hypothetical protein [Methanoregula sp.]